MSYNQEQYQYDQQYDQQQQGGGATSAAAGGVEGQYQEEGAGGTTTTQSWLGNGATSSLLNNDVAIYGGGESLWILSLPTLQWNEVWTSGDCPAHGLRFHTATSVRIPEAATVANRANKTPSMTPNQSDGNDSSVSSSSGGNFGALVVCGGEPRASMDLPEAHAHGEKMAVHVLRVRSRSWTVLKSSGDQPLNRCFHTTTKLRGTTLAVYGGRPLGQPGETDEAAPFWDDTDDSAIAELIQRGFYDVFLVDVATGIWRRIPVNHSSGGGGNNNNNPLPCLWGHAAFATSVFPPRRSTTGDYRHRIDLVIHGGFDLNINNNNNNNNSSNNDSKTTTASGAKAYVLQPVSEAQPTVLKWGPAPLDGDSATITVGEYALHTSASPDSVREGAHPAFLMGGFISSPEEVTPANSCARILVRASSYQEGARGQIIQLPPLEALYSAENATARPLLLYYSDQLLIVENTDRVWLLDLQETQNMEWAVVETALGPNEDVERWRLGCPVHSDFTANNPCDAEEAQVPQHLIATMLSAANASATGKAVAQGGQSAIRKRRSSLQERRERRQKERDQEIAAASGGKIIEDDEEEEGGGSGGGGVSGDNNNNHNQQQESPSRRKSKKNKEGQEPKIPPPPKAGDVRGEWKALMDEKRQRMYFVNTTTKKSTWKIEETSFSEPLPVSDHDSFYHHSSSSQNEEGQGGRGAWGKATSSTPANHNNNNQQSYRDPSSQQQQQNHEGGGGGGSMSRFLGEGSGPENTGTSSWWNAAGDAKARADSQSYGRPGEQSQGRAPSSSVVAPPSRAPSSTVPPPSGTPSDINALITKPDHDLAIDFLLNAIDHEEELSLQRERQQQQQQKGGHVNNSRSGTPSLLFGKDLDEVFQVPTAVAPPPDPVEALNYPFKIEETLLAPADVVLKARAARKEAILEEEQRQAALVKEREFDVKKFLKRNTHWESESEYGRRSQAREERSQYHESRSVVDMLPSMLEAAAAELESPEPVRNPNESSSSSSKGKATPRPSALAAADYSHTGSAAGSAYSSRASTPLNVNPFAESGNNSGLNSRSISVQSVHGLGRHHVSQALRDMMGDSTHI